jgi:hypothetical protein
VVESARSDDDDEAGKSLVQARARPQELRQGRTNHLRVLHTMDSEEPVLVAWRSAGAADSTLQVVADAEYSKAAGIQGPGAHTASLKRGLAGYVQRHEGAAASATVAVADDMPMAETGANCPPPLHQRAPGAETRRHRCSCCRCCRCCRC